MLMVGEYDQKWFELILSRKRWLNEWISFPSERCFHGDWILLNRHGPSGSSKDHHGSGAGPLFADRSQHMLRALLKCVDIGRLC